MSDIFGNVFDYAEGESVFGNVFKVVPLPDIQTGIHPIAPWYSVIDQRGNSYLANGVDEPACLPASSNLCRKWGIDAPTDTPTAVATGTGVLTSSGTGYVYAWAWVNATAGTVSNPTDYTTATTATSEKIQLYITGSTSDTQVTHKRIFRNTMGQADVLYKVADVTATTNNYLDNNSDDDISVNDIMETDHDPPSGFRPYVLFHQGRVHLFGSRVESSGTISIGAGSTTVVGSGTQFKASHVGQTLVVSGSTKGYLVSSVSTTTSLTLASAHSGSVSGAGYKIYNASQYASWQWSKAGYEEYFPFENETNVFENDNDDPTGLFAIRGQMFASKRRHIYRLLWQSDPSAVTGDGGIFLSLDNRGAVSQRCIVCVGALAYILDERGFYTFDGASAATPIDQAVRRLVNPSDEPAADRINWTYRDKFHGIYDPKRDRVLWFVTMGADTEPRHAFVFDCTMQRWTIEEYRQGITSSCLVEDDQKRLRVFVGDENGFVWALGISPARDGAPPSSQGTIRGTLTGVSGATLTDSAAAFYTTGQGLDGVPVYIDSGTGAGSWGIIQSNSGTALTLKAALDPQAAIGSTYIIGPIEMHVQSRWFSASSPGMPKVLRAVRLYFEKESTSMELRLRIYRDWSSTPFTEWSSVQRSEKDGLRIPTTATTDGTVLCRLNETHGYVDVPLGRDFAHWIKFDFRFIDSERKPKLIGYEWVADPDPQATKYR